MKENKLKIGWAICHSEDYVSVSRCFKCSRFNHHFSESRSDETCPLCAGNHKMRDCKATRTECKCISCITYKKFNQNKTVKEDHSAIDRKYPSMQEMVENTDKTRHTEMATAKHKITRKTNKKQTTI